MGNTSENKPMEVRITFRSEITLKGNDLAEVRGKWESAELGDAEFIEICSVEDANDRSDLTDEFCK